MSEEKNEKKPGQPQATLQGAAQFQSKTGPDYSAAGWPETVQGLFRSPEWYEPFEEKYRPQFKDTAASSTTFPVYSADDVKKREYISAQPCKMLTFVNLTLGDQYLDVPAMNGSGTVRVMLPPFGVMCAPADQVNQLLQAPARAETLVKGKRNYFRFALIAPKGSCDGEHWIEPKDASGKVLERLQTCRLFGCSQHVAPSGIPLSVNQSYSFIESCGAPIRYDDGHEVLTDVAHAIKQLDELTKNHDRRFLVNSFVNMRKLAITERETARSIRTGSFTRGN